MAKRGVIIFLFLLMLSFPLTSALNFEMKETFDRGETLTAKISGYFLNSILKENIFFYRGHVRIAMNYDITRIEGDYYLYAELSDKVPGNYSVVVKNVRYVKLGKTIDEDIVKNFSITSDWADFSVTPGFVLAQDDFFLTLRTIKDEDVFVNVKIESLNKTTESSVILTPRRNERINFPLVSFDKGLNFIELSTENLNYKIPVNAFFTEVVQEQGDFKFEPNEMNISVPTNSNSTRVLYLYNIGNKNLKNISISVSSSLEPYVEVWIENIEELEENSNVAVAIFISSPEDEEILQGHIKAKSSENWEELLTYAQIYLSFLQNYVPEIEDEVNIPASAKTCSELKGVICKSDEKCVGGEIYAKDNKCCLGECEKLPKEKNPGRVIGWVILICVVILLAWFFLKHRKIRKPADLLKISKGKR